MRVFVDKSRDGYYLIGFNEKAKVYKIEDYKEDIPDFKNSLYKLYDVLNKDFNAENDIIKSKILQCVIDYIISLERVIK